MFAAKKGKKAPVEEFISTDIEKYVGKIVRFGEESGKIVKDPFWGSLRMPEGEFYVTTAKPYGRPTDTTPEWLNTKTIAGITARGENVTFILPGRTVMKMFGREGQVNDLHKQLALMSRIRDGRLRGYSVGSDPEFFATTKDGQLLPAFDYLGDKPKPVKEKPGYPAQSNVHVYHDGYQGEMSTNAHACLAWLVDEVQRSLKNANQAAKMKSPGAKLSVATVFDIPPERLMKDAAKYVEFGCKPSLNVYGDSFPPIDPRAVPFRSAGGHLHFSYPASSSVEDAVRWLDRILGVISVSMFQRYDEPRRRAMYGRAGEYRKAVYGFEYRALSNAWMITPGTMNFVYEVARRVLGELRSGMLDESWKTTDEETRSCINNCDVRLAHEIINRNKDYFNALIASLPVINEKGEAGWRRMVYEGVHVCLRRPDEYAKAWCLDEGVWTTHADGPCGNILGSTDEYLRSGYIDVK
jgi:hypothetical protein